MASVIDIDITNASSLPRIPRTAIASAIRQTCRVHGCTAATVSVVLVNDRRIRSINARFLQHDYATDVITFPLDERMVDGEIYISVDTAARQAKEYGVNLTQELLRLVIHGVLHLLGFDDATPEERAEMHEQENAVLILLERKRAREKRRRVRQ
ncbi:MAG: rRNA maturation RNase YbeY [Candidatus Kapaibacterium sp.]